MADSCFLYFFLFYTVFSQQWYCLGVHLVFCPLFLGHCGIYVTCSLSITQFGNLCYFF